ncbi:MAG: hypothetical protein U5K79_16480 [Cyclobacteriaceae bacterium]|nr:hypothetical protein [Cyclobacteriaceae bacterium]
MDLILSRRATEEEKNIVSRFATEFGRVYPAFPGSSKSGSTGKGIQIQVAMERVRAKTMAMHNSNELRIASVLFEQISLLTIHLTVLILALQMTKTEHMMFGLLNQQGHKISKLFVAAAGKSPGNFRSI